MKKIKLNTFLEIKKPIQNYKYSSLNLLRIIFAGSNTPKIKVKKSII
ncbi:hypothetical protein OAB63_02840 [Alphaproteobacteria bacterium]|nr:hypothetical protein [Alphaproteobacteria bacterium]MDC0861204.1 hypothetical protein [Alphaproteobacteria bacterium]